jgi:hypothetical protein
MALEYITLAASLPTLPYFEKALRLPLTELALLQRLKMLNETDLKQLHGAVALLRWKRHSATVPTEQVEKQYRAVRDTLSNDALREFVDWRINSRAVIAALRLKVRGQTARPQQVWGAGPLVRSIERNWEKPDLGLQGLFPWINEAREHLARGNALALDRLKNGVVWRRLTTMGELNAFGFEFVAAYCFKWDILQRWIRYQPESARRCFENLVQEVMGEHRIVWA